MGALVYLRHTNALILGIRLADSSESNWVDWNWMQLRSGYDIIHIYSEAKL